MTQAVFSAFKRICRQTEKEINARQKFSMMDPSQLDQLTETQKQALMDDVSLVGDTDGSGFGIGVASKDLRSSKVKCSQIKFVFVL